MLWAFDTLLQTNVSASAAAINSDNEAFRYECLCCGEEVYLAAQDSIYKATHFRHRSGNNDKDCELYLGQYGIVPTTSSARNKKQDRVEFYYQNTHKAFYVSFRFSDAEITAYENTGACLEVRSSRALRPFFTQRINHTNFHEDSPGEYMLEMYASPYYISNTLNNIKREYSLFGTTGPTFFKIQGEDKDYSAKYIKSKSLYTNVKYFIAWPGQNTAQIKMAKVPGVAIDELMQFKTMNNCTVWALVATFTNKNPQLDALLQTWGYDLSTSEELILLWPPAYENDEALHVSSNKVYVYSSFVLQAHGNTNMSSHAIHKVDNDITEIEIGEKLRILKKNAEMTVVTTELVSEYITQNIKHITTEKFIVPESGIFYRFSSCGVEKLTSGQVVFLTDTSSVIEYCGNYISTVITLSKEELSLTQRMLEALAYYWVSVPFEGKIENHYPDIISKYLQDSKAKGLINKAVLALFEEEKMYNFSSLTEDEYRKICSAIPHNIIVGYFQKNPKEFSKIRPGFRAAAVQNKDAIKLLVINRERGFISSFVERIAGDWLKDIQSVIQDYQNNGESEITSYIHTLYQSFFSDNVSAFFKLINKDYNEDQLEMIANLVALLKKIDEKQHELEASSHELKEELTACERKTEKSEKTLEKANKKLAELTSKQSNLESLQKKYLKLLNDYEQSTKEKERAILQVDELKKQVSLLNETVAALQKENEQLEISIRAKIEEEKETEALHAKSSFPIAPVDMDEFIEYFSYNLESIGVVNSDLPINTLLTTYMSGALFHGKPIICNRTCADTLAKCLSNTLINNAPANNLSFSPDLDEKRICAALNVSGRIVVLENFLGNINETLLLSILDKYKAKIIILSVTYEKTLLYLPKDFLAYCYYLNLSRIPGFVRATIPDEDPSIIAEEEITQVAYPAKNRFQDTIRSIARELGLSALISGKISEFVCDDKTACAVLALSIIPYINDVLEKNAFNISETLQRYTNRCPYKKMFEEWFAV